ncbi:MAG: 6-phospho-3-hexuloisomerase [Anaerolineae bacterium]|nr:SIS domain-containing protein [Anaerolineae bacterium]MDW8100306.1 6-phospho-3-hexuloisomerase [Anaerolineae bacterium]
MATYTTLAAQIAAELTQTLTAVREESVESLVRGLREASRIFLAGAGRAGWIMRTFAVRLTHLSLAVHVVGDATTPAIGPGDLLVIGSGSGETTSLVGHATAARRYGAKIALITTAPGSSVGRQADVIVHIPAPTPKAMLPYTVGPVEPPRSIQPMANLFEQALLIVLDIITMRLMEEMRADPAQMFARHANLE